MGKRQVRQLYTVQMHTCRFLAILVEIIEGKYHNSALPSTGRAIHLEPRQYKKKISIKQNSYQKVQLFQE